MTDEPCSREAEVRSETINADLDIDNAITRMPAFFAALSRAVRASVGKVILVTS